MMPRSMVENAIAEVYGDSSKLTPEVKQRYFDLAMREGNKGSYVDIFTMLRTENDSATLSADIPHIQAPTLLMWGTKDAWIPPEQLDNWRRDLPSASFVTFEGLGHVPMEEAPAMTVEPAIRFLRGSGPP
jgi:pimeloyl-ACP methyl ester carboxylesterase